jgi:hypothetical protein
MSWSRRKTACTLVALGYVGAGIRYWRWGGLPETVQMLACPMCPHIDSLGTDWEKFSGRLVGQGTINAVVYLCIFWLVVTIWDITHKAKDIGGL